MLHLLVVFDDDEEPQSTVIFEAERADAANRGRDLCNLGVCFPYSKAVIYEALAGGGNELVNVAAIVERKFGASTWEVSPPDVEPHSEDLE